MDGSMSSPTEPWGKKLASATSPVRDLAGLITLLLLPAFTYRALFVAQFDISVATALVQYTAPLSLVLQFFVTAWAILGMLASYALVYQLGKHWHKIGDRRAISLAAVAVGVPLLLLPALSISEWYLAASMLLMFPAIAHSGYRHSKPSSERRGIERFAIALVQLTGALVIVILAVATPRMWIPPELLVTTSGESKKAYVLQQTDTDLIIFDPGVTAVVRMPASTVRSRQFCGPEKPFRTLPELLFGKPAGRPSCDL